MSLVKPYGSWPSPFDAAAVTAGQKAVGEPRVSDGDIFWIETRPGEGGRQVLIRHREHLSVEVGPNGFNTRTRVHEYGGGAYAVTRGLIVAANFADQRLYRLGAQPAPLTPESDGRLRFADMAIPSHRRWLIAIREDHTKGGEPRNTIVRLSLLGDEDQGQPLFDKADFVASPRLSPDGRRLAWVSWNHPDMPWDASRLWTAQIDEDGRLRDTLCLNPDSREAVLQPVFGPDGRLYAMTDRSGYWNLTRWPEAEPVIAIDHDCAPPPWQLGQASFAWLTSERLAYTVAEDGLWRLETVSAGGTVTRLAENETEISHLQADNGSIVCRVASPERAARIVRIDGETGEVQPLSSVDGALLLEDHLSKPQPIWFDSEGRRTHAFFYPPSNGSYRGPPGEKPPLIVKSHGGPTGAARTDLNLKTQFWTSRGFAMVDVNYGGSTGFGRAYRERLNGRWGEVDVADCLAAARHLAERELADPERMAITGGSAGGFTTLSALVFHDLFKAGANHFGVADLTALAADTHKFESRYLDTLVGPYPQAKALYEARSPINAADRLSCPVIFFQGLEDKIVPPNQAERMVEVLRAKGLPVAYFAFPGEQHGFRQAETIQTVLMAELAFYCRVFGIERAERLPDLPF
ncbi:MAG: prolyl oligopeptidase family serine peptidase [Geminicoccaceae bacterium]